MKLVRESIKDIFVPKELTQKQKAAWAIFKGDPKSLEKAFEDGAKLSYGLLRKIYTGWSYDLVNFLKNYKNIDSILIPKDAEKIKYVLNIKPMSYKKYPRFYKQYRVLKHINDNIITKRYQLIKLIYELGYGPNSYNPLEDTGYWSTNYHQTIGQYYAPVIKGRKFILNSVGRKKLNILHNKFKDQDLDPYV